MNKEDLQFLRVAGYCRAGPLAVRVDILERLIGQLRKRAVKGVFASDPDLLNLVGCTLEQMMGVLESLGYKRVGDREEACFEPVTRLLKNRKTRSRQKSTNRAAQPKGRLLLYLRNSQSANERRISQVG